MYVRQFIQHPSVYQNSKNNPTRSKLYNSIYLQEIAEIMNKNNQPLASYYIKLALKQSSYSNNNQTPYFIITIYSQNTNQPIQTVYRSLNQIENLSRYIIKKYGGFIVPVVDKRLWKIMRFQVEEVLELETYLEDLRQSAHCGTDKNYYCFLFDQAMQLPEEQLYTRMLSKASTISKKYLNSIFTRKQFPQQQPTFHLLTIYEQITELFKQFNSLSNFAQTSISQQRILEQILTNFSQLSCSPSPSCNPHQDLLLQTQKIMQIGKKYIKQTQQAYQRWQILVQGVRQSKNQIMKGLNENEQKWRIKSQILAKWTKSLKQDMESMSRCFIELVEKMCQNINQIKLTSSNQQQYQQNKQKQIQIFANKQNNQHQQNITNNYISKQYKNQEQKQNKNNNKQITCFQFPIRNRQNQVRQIQEQKQKIGTQTTLDQLQNNNEINIYNKQLPRHFSANL